MQNQPVAYQAAVQENVDAISIEPLRFRTLRKAGYRERGFYLLLFEFRLCDGSSKGRGYRRNFYQLIERLLAKKLIDAVGQLFRRCAVDDLLRRSCQNKLLCGIRQGVVRDE